MNDATARRSRYSQVSIALHWLIALLVIGNLIGGLTHEYWTDSADPAMKATGAQIMAIHKSIGLTVLVLTLVRIAWRLGHPWLPLPDHMTRFERVLARATHYGFYALLLLLPLSGWAMVSAGRRAGPVSWFGAFSVPKLPTGGLDHELFEQVHGVLGWTAVALVALHVAGALKHQYFDRDEVLARMLPWVKARG